jgi:FdhD protein
MSDEEHATTPEQLDAVEESAVWLELNGAPAVTWMCTPERLDELVVGWLFGEGYIDSQGEIVRMRPCTSELGFWVEVPVEKYNAIERAERRRVLASGCGAVTTILGSMTDVPRRRNGVPQLDTPTLRKLFKELFARGERYKDTGGIHAAALTDGETLLYHAEDIGRHNAVDKVLGAAVLDDRSPEDLILLVTGRISGELAFKAARARISIVATPSIPSSIAVDISKAAHMVLIGRAVSGHPQVHGNVGTAQRESGIGNRESDAAVKDEQRESREPETGKAEARAE